MSFFGKIVLKREKSEDRLASRTLLSPSQFLSDRVLNQERS